MRNLRVSQTAVFERVVRDYVEPAPPMVARGTPCAEALALMRRQQASCLIVTDGGERVLGIVTEQDIVRRVAIRAPRSMPIEQAMSSPVLTIRDDDLLFRAIAVMRRRGLRHMPVLDRHGRIAGMLHLHTALGSAMPGLLELIDRLTHESTAAGLRQLKDAQVELAEALLEDRIPATEVQALLSHINRDIYRRILEQALADLADEGWGEPPVAFDAIIMGSGGRGESFLFPDQDNGFVLDDYAPARHQAVDAYFHELATRLTQSLDAVGIRYCRGDVMATNPLWRKSLGQWRLQIDAWLRTPVPQALLNVDIFLDFQPVFGSGDLARALREHVVAATPSHPLFLGEMGQVHRQHRAALGRFGRLKVERTAGPRRGTISLKLGGLLPLVNAVRLLALRQGVPQTGTVARLAALHASGLLADNDYDDVVAAFHHLTGLVLRNQLRAFRAGEPVGASVAPEALSRRERGQLVRSLRAINALHRRAHMEVTGEIL